MTLKIGHADRMTLAVAAGVTAVLAREAEARQLTLDRRLQPMRHVIDALECIYGPNAQPLEHPHEFADLVARHGASHLRERDVQLLHESIIESSDRDCAHIEALANLDDAREASGNADDGNATTGFLAWLGVSREQYLAAIHAALRSHSRLRSMRDGRGGCRIRHSWDGRMMPMPRIARLPRTPNCPACGRPGSYVWKAETFRDTYACMTASCPLGEYQRHCARSHPTASVHEQ